MKRKMKKNVPYICIVNLCLLSVAFSSLAFVASSTNYRIQFDSLNVGGVLSTSTEYRIEDTMGEVATGDSSSTEYVLHAGYQQMNESTISISFSDSSVTLLPAIGGLSGGTATGTVTATVITDNEAGYSLYLKASTSPALAFGSYNFADYVPASAGTPDYTWSVSSSDAEFGFSPEGSDIYQKFQDDGGDCNTGSGDSADACWYGFSTSNELVGLSYSSAFPSGRGTVVKFRAESGGNNFQPEGTYQATIIATALAN